MTQATLQQTALKEVDERFKWVLGEPSPAIQAALLHPCVGFTRLKTLGVSKTVIQEARDKLTEWVGCLTREVAVDSRQAAVDADFEKMFNEAPPASSATPTSKEVVDRLLKAVVSANLAYKLPVIDLSGDNMGDVFVSVGDEIVSPSRAVELFYSSRAEVEQKLVRLVFSAAPTSASAERGFSAMKLIHSDIRSSMYDSTLEMLLIVRSCLKQVTAEDTARAFEEFMNHILMDSGRRLEALLHARKTFELN